MVRGIIPSVEGNAKALFGSSAAHTIGGGIGGAASFALVWVVATPLRTFVPARGMYILAGATLVWALLRDLGIPRRPSGGRQVPQGWMSRFRPAVAFFLYGIELGTGFMTFAPYAVFFTLLAVANLYLGFPESVLIGMSFGLGRTLPVGLIALAARRRDRLDTVLGKLYEILPRVSAALSIIIVAGGGFPWWA